MRPFSGLRQLKKLEDTDELVIQGEACLYHSHSSDPKESRTWRHSEMYSCVECVDEMQRGKITLDVEKLHKVNRSPALNFWSKVDITDIDSCWRWTAPLWKKHLYHFWKRTEVRSQYRHHPVLIAMWLSWGDIGRAGSTTRCGERYCCNPLHNLPKGILGTDVIEKVDRAEFEQQIRTLKQQIRAHLAPKFEQCSDKEEFVQGISFNQLPEHLKWIDKQQKYCDSATPFDSALNAAMNDLLNKEGVTSKYS